MGERQTFLPTTFKIGPKRHISKLKTRNDQKKKKEKKNRRFQ